MVRMQIQFSDSQAERLKQLSAQTGRSIAAIVRDAVGDRLESDTREGEWERALSAIGAFESGTGDVSVEHDRYLAEAYAGRLR